MPQDAVTWAALIAAIGAVLTLIKFWMSVSDKITVARTRADEAAKDVEDLQKYTHKMSERISVLDGLQALHRETVAREYTHRDTLREMEERVTTAIDKLSERLDRFLENHSVRPTPRG